MKVTRFSKKIKANILIPGGRADQFNKLIFKFCRQDLYWAHFKLSRIGLTYPLLC